MNAKKLSMYVAAGVLIAAAQTGFATEMGTQGGANAQAQVGTGTGTGAGANAQVGTGTGTGAGVNAQVGTDGAAAGAQVGTPGAQPAQPGMPQGTGTQAEVNVKTNSGAPITGALTVKDPTLRTFVIEGREQVYVAPETVDIQQFQGKDVIIMFDPNGRVTTIELDREG